MRKVGEESRHCDEGCKAVQGVIRQEGGDLPVKGAGEAPWSKTQPDLEAGRVGISQVKTEGF